MYLPFILSRSIKVTYKNIFLDNLSHLSSQIYLDKYQVTNCLSFFEILNSTLF